jgi:plasmid stabilization system protein ParE
MRWTVVWRDDAKNDLARIWVESEDRQSVSVAADHIDRSLQMEPEQQGEEFYGDGLLVMVPLAVVFAVFPDDRLVRVLQVWKFGATEPNAG